jgi:hypothetical protein
MQDESIRRLARDKMLGLSPFAANYARRERISHPVENTTTP